MFPPSNGSSPLYRKSTTAFRPTQDMPTSSTYRQEEDKLSTIPWYSMCRKFSLQYPTYLFLVFLLHTQGEHSMEVRAGDGQQGSVSRDALVIGNQNHIAELAVLPLLVKTLQQLCSLFHPAEHLQTQGHKVWRSWETNILLSVFTSSLSKFWFCPPNFDLFKRSLMRDFLAQICLRATSCPTVLLWKNAACEED